MNQIKFSYLKSEGVLTDEQRGCRLENGDSKDEMLIDKVVLMDYKNININMDIVLPTVGLGRLWSVCCSRELTQTSYWEHEKLETSVISKWRSPGWGWSYSKGISFLYLYFMHYSFGIDIKKGQGLLSMIKHLSSE